jgi:hypothetical protein
MMIQYQKLFRVPKHRDMALDLDFSTVDFLNVFEINELFFYCATNFSFTALNVIGTTPVVGYLTRANFFHELSVLKEISGSSPSPYSNGSNRLLELQCYRYKAEFESQASRIFDLFKEFGLKDQSASILLGELSEIVDNAFSHNLGKWPLPKARAICLIQKYPRINRLAISLCDFGVGFLETLRINYPDLKNDEEAIRLALQPQTTSRIGFKGGNGLHFLRTNLFNGLPAFLTIRSRNVTVAVRKFGIVEKIASPEFALGAHVGIELEYTPAK